MAADARRCPASARRGIPGVPRSTYYRMLAHPPRPKAPDPIEPDVLGAFEGPRGGYGARRLKVALERSGIVASRRRICRIMRGSGLSSSCSGRAPRTHVASDLTCVRAGGSWCCACPLVDPCNREIVGCSCGRRKDARLVKAAFSNAAFPLTAIEVFHGDRGSEFCNGDVDAPLSAFGIERSVSRPGC